MRPSAVYGIGVLALIHYFQQTKADVSVPTFTAGVFVWLLGYRIVVRLWKVRGELSTPALAGLSFAVAGLTLAAEAISLAIVFNVSPLVVLQSDFDVEVDLDMVRPGWLVLVAGLLVALVNFGCARLMKPPGRVRTPGAGKEPPRSRDREVERALAPVN